jgi:hypothetical protein
MLPYDPRRMGTRRRQAARLVLSLASTLAVLAAPQTGADASAPRTASAAPCPVSAELVPSCGDWWGEAVPTTGTTLLAAVDATEAQTGRSLEIVHTYHRWAQVFPTAEEAALATSGHILLINWQPTDAAGGPISWESIADGSQDSVIRAEAHRLAALREPVMLTFSHEPEPDLSTEGSSAQFVAAYRHVHDLVVADGATNVIWVWDVEGLSTRYWRNSYHLLWPGSAYVDWIAWDPYNFASCRHKPWQTFEELVTPFYRWIRAQSFGKLPLMLAEFGTVGEPTGSDSKQAWYAGAASSVSKFPALKALVYFDYPSPPASCDWVSNSSPAAAAAFARLARSSVFVQDASP